MARFKRAIYKQDVSWKKILPAVPEEKVKGHEISKQKRNHERDAILVEQTILPAIPQNVKEYDDPFLARPRHLLASSSQTVTIEVRPISILSI